MTQRDTSTLQTKPFTFTWINVRIYRRCTAIKVELIIVILKNCEHLQEILQNMIMNTLLFYFYCILLIYELNITFLYIEYVYFKQFSLFFPII